MSYTLKNFENQTICLIKKTINILQIKEDFFPKEFDITSFSIHNKPSLSSDNPERFYIEIIVKNNDGLRSDHQRYVIDIKSIVEKDLQYYKDKKIERERTLVPHYQKQIKTASEKLKNLEVDLKNKIALVRKNAKVNSVSKMLEEVNEVKYINKEIKSIRSEIKNKTEHIIKLL